MTPEEMKNEFQALYNMMANSQKVEFMHTFGVVHKEMMEWMIANKPDFAQEWIDKLESIKWRNYLTPKEADAIVAKMSPKAPWGREQWKTEMERYDFDIEDEPCYNHCALWVTMNMIMSDSGNTLSRYVETDNLFNAVYDLAVDKLTDPDKVFNIRRYFSL